MTKTRDLQTLLERRGFCRYGLISLKCRCTKITNNTLQIISTEWTATEELLVSMMQLGDKVEYNFKPSCREKYKRIMQEDELVTINLADLDDPTLVLASKRDMYIAMAWEIQLLDGWPHVCCGDSKPDNGTSISKKLRYSILRRDRFTCQHCGRKAPDVELQVDHIFPRSRGGTNEVSNLQTLCVDCNQGKTNTV